MVETDEHNGIGELGAIVDTVSFVAVHVVTAGAESEDVGAAVCVSLERIVGFRCEGKEIKNVAVAAGDFGDEIVAPKDCPDGKADDEENNSDNNDAGDFFSFAFWFFDILVFLGFFVFFGFFGIGGF